MASVFSIQWCSTIFAIPHRWHCWNDVGPILIADFRLTMSQRCCWLLPLNRSSWCDAATHFPVIAYSTFPTAGYDFGWSREMWISFFNSVKGEKTNSAHTAYSSKTIKYHHFATARWRQLSRWNKRKEKLIRLNTSRSHEMAFHFNCFVRIFGKPTI